MEQVAELRKRWDVRLRAGGQQLYVRLGFGPTPPMLGMLQMLHMQLRSTMLPTLSTQIEHAMLHKLHVQFM